jgi:hypothetical protein
MSNEQSSSFAERSRRILNTLSECVYFFADLFPEYSQTLEPVLNFVDWNVGVPPPDRNRINGKLHHRISKLKLKVVD